MTRQRGFERITQFSDEEYKDLLPKRETAHAAGYDLKVAEPTTIDPGEITLFLQALKPICNQAKYSFFSTAQATLEKGASAYQFSRCD